MLTQIARRATALVLGVTTLLVTPIASLALRTPVAYASHDAVEKIYVGQRGLASIAVIDATTLQPTSTSPISLGTGAVPQEVVADPLRPVAYVADSGLNQVEVVNTIDDAVAATIPVSAGPQGMTLSADGAYLYVATNTQVLKLDTRSRAVVASVTMTPFTPWDVTLSNDGMRLWVTAGATTGEVRSLNPSTLAQTDTITPAGAASGAGILGDQLNPSPNSARYADRVNHLLYTFDDLNNTSGSITSSVYVAGPWALASEPLATGADPDKFLVTDGGGSAVLGGDTVYEYDGALGPGQTRSVTNLGGSPTPDSPTEIAYSASATTAYVTLRATSKVSVISYDPAGALAETNVVSLAASADPYGIAVVRSEYAPQVFAGSDRYATAVKASQELYGDQSVDALIVARGDAFPDGLAAGPLASMVHGPLLLTKPNALPTATKDEIARVFDQVTDAATDVFVIGGTSAVSNGVVSSIQAISSKLNVQRISGADRIETAVNVAKQEDILRAASPTTAFVAKSSDYPDALAASGYAGNAVFYPSFAPVLLTGTSALDSRVKTYLQATNPTIIQAYLLGGTTALSSAVASAMSAITTTTRLGGANRYATAVTAAKNFFPTGPTGVGVASGQNFPDALVLGPLVGKQDLTGQTANYSMPILLVKTASVPAEVSSYFGTFAATVKRAFVSGGTAAVSSATVSSLASLY